MTEVVDAWLMKSVNPPKSVWYMTWSASNPDVVFPSYFDGKNWTIGMGVIMREYFDMWCRQPAPPDAATFHQLRAILMARND